MSTQPQHQERKGVKWNCNFLPESFADSEIIATFVTGKARKTLFSGHFVTELLPAFKQNRAFLLYISKLKAKITIMGDNFDRPF